jgi:hypothetical protein
LTIESSKFDSKTGFIRSFNNSTMILVNITTICLRKTVTAKKILKYSLKKAIEGFNPDECLKNGLVSSQLRRKQTIQQHDDSSVIAVFYQAMV